MAKKKPENSQLDEKKLQNIRKFENKLTKYVNFQKIVFFNRYNITYFSENLPKKELISTAINCHNN